MYYFINLQAQTKKNTTSHNEDLKNSLFGNQAHIQLLLCILLLFYNQFPKD